MEIYTRRSKVMEASQDRPPAGFVYVDYIQNTSNAYIDTRCYPTSDTEVEMTVENDANTSYRGLIGVNNSGSSRWGVDQHASSNTNARFSYGSGNVNIGTIANGSKTTIKIDGNKLKRNSTSYTCSGTWPGGALSNPIHLFRMYAGAQSCALMKLHGQTIIKTEGILRRDYRPVRRLSDNKYGLWDKVSQTFFTSPNGTNFVGGKHLVISSLCRTIKERRAA